MYYIVETEQQLKNLHCSGNKCYIKIIPMNDEYHSVLSSPCLVYFKTENSKGYMFPINHSEAFKLPFDKVMKWIDSKYDRIYTLNKKEVLYYFDNNKLVDISYDRDSDFQHYTKFRDRMYSHFSHLEFTNSLVPISKHYETEEKTYEDIKSSFL